MVGAFPFFLDFAHSLAIVAALAWGYGLVSRRIARPGWAPAVLGGVFGCVAVMEMHTPLELVDGVIVDLRAIPIVLSGAFLGWRGALVCVAIAVSARLGLGGVGTLAGVAAILIAGAVGLCWSYVTRQTARRRAEHLVWLAIGTSLSLLGGLLLPPEFSSWFFSEMALPLAGIYLIAVPLAAAVMERERVLFETRGGAAWPDGIDTKTGLRDQERFARDVAHATASGSQAPVAGAVILKIRDSGFLTEHWGQSVLGHVLGGLRHRFAPLERNGGVLGLKDDGSLLVSVGAGDWSRVEDFRTELTRVASDDLMVLPHSQSTRVAVSSRFVRFSDPADARAVMDDIDAANPVRPAGRIRINNSIGSRRQNAHHDTRQGSDTNDVLFAHANALIDARGA